MEIVSWKTITDEEGKEVDSIYVDPIGKDDDEVGDDQRKIIVPFNNFNHYAATGFNAVIHCENQAEKVIAHLQKAQVHLKSLYHMTPPVGNEGASTNIKRAQKGLQVIEYFLKNIDYETGLCTQVKFEKKEKKSGVAKRQRYLTPGQADKRNTTLRMPYQCFCGKICESTADLAKHTEEHGDDIKKWPCSACGMVGFSRYSTLWIHFNHVHQGKDPFVCTFVDKDGEPCQWHGKEKGALVSHQCHQHGLPRPDKWEIYCGACGSTQGTNRQLREHVLHCAAIEEKKKNIHHCPVCEHPFVKDKLMHAHFYLHHSGPNYDVKLFPFKCYICDKALETKGGLRQHHHAYHKEEPWRTEKGKWQKPSHTWSYDPADFERYSAFRVQQLKDEEEAKKRRKKEKEAAKKRAKASTSTED